MGGVTLAGQNRARFTDPLGESSNSEITWRLMKSGWAVDREGLQNVSRDESTL